MKVVGGKQAERWTGKNCGLNIPKREIIWEI